MIQSDLYMDFFAQLEPAQTIVLPYQVKSSVYIKTGRSLHAFPGYYYVIYPLGGTEVYLENFSFNIVNAGDLVEVNFKVRNLDQQTIIIQEGHLLARAYLMKSYGIGSDKSPKGKKNEIK